MAIAMILMAAATLLQNAVRHSRLATQSNELMASLRLARSESFKRMHPVTVCASADGANCSAANSKVWEVGWIVFLDPNNNGKVDNGETVFRTIGQWQSNYTLRTDANIASSLKYQANGRIDKNNGSFILCFNNTLNQSKAIFVSNSGRVYPGQDSDGNGIPEDEFGNNIASCTP